MSREGWLWKNRAVKTEEYGEGGKGGSGNNSNLSGRIVGDEREGNGKRLFSST